MIHQAGAKLFYLPSYSPDLNSTEKLWAKVKAFLRKRRALTPEALQRRDRLRLPVLHLLIAETGLQMQSVDEILWDRSGFYRFLKSKRNTSIFVYGRTNRDFNPQLFTKLFT